MLKPHQKPDFPWKRKPEVKGNFTHRLASINQLTYSAVCLKVALLKPLHINEGLPSGPHCCVPALCDRKWLTMRRRLQGEQWWVTVRVSKNMHAVFNGLQIVAEWRHQEYLWQINTQLGSGCPGAGGLGNNTGSHLIHHTTVENTYLWMSQCSYIDLFSSDTDQSSSSSHSLSIPISFLISTFSLSSPSIPWLVSTWKYILGKILVLKRHQLIV